MAGLDIRNVRKVDLRIEPPVLSPQDESIDERVRLLEEKDKRIGDLIETNTELQGGISLLERVNLAARRAQIFSDKVFDARSYSEIAEETFRLLEGEYRDGGKLRAELGILKGFDENWFWNRVQKEAGISRTKLKLMLSSNRLNPSTYQPELFEEILPRIQPFVHAWIASRHNFGSQETPERANLETTLRVLDAIEHKRIIYHEDTSVLPEERRVEGVGSEFTYAINKLSRDRPEGVLEPQDSKKYEMPVGFLYVGMEKPEAFPKNLVTGQLFHINPAVAQSVILTRRAIYGTYKTQLLEATNGQNNLDSLFYSVSETLEKILGPVEIALSIVDPKTKELVIKYVYGNESKRNIIGENWGDDDPVVQDLRSGRKERAMTANVYEKEFAQRNMSKEMLERKLKGTPKSSFRIALRVEEGQEAVGILEIKKKERRLGSAVGDEDADLVAQIASPFAVAINRANYTGKIERRSKTDSLTGFHNRWSFEERLVEEYEKAQRRPRNVVLAYFDINDLKKINDESGSHEEGDMAFRHIAQAFRSRTRPDDIIGRLGGDEFAALFVDATQSQIYKRVRGILEELYGIKLPDTKRSPSVSVGIARLDLGCSLPEWKERADASTYFSKATKGIPETGATIYTPRVAVYRLLRGLNNGRAAEISSELNPHLERLGPNREIFIGMYKVEIDRALEENDPLERRRRLLGNLKVITRDSTIYPAIESYQLAKGQISHPYTGARH